MLESPVVVPGLFFGTRYICIDPAGNRTIEFLYGDGTSAIDTVQLGVNQAILFAKLGDGQFAMSSQAELYTAFPVNKDTLGTQYQATIFELPDIEREYTIITGNFAINLTPADNPWENCAVFCIRNSSGKKYAIEEGDLVLTAEPCITGDVNGYEVVHASIKWISIVVNCTTMFVPEAFNARWLKLFSAELNTPLKAGAIIRKISK